MSTTRALRELGVTEQALPGEERARLDRDGFLVLGQLLPAHQAAARHHRLEALRASEGADAGRDFFQEVGSVYLGDLLNGVATRRGGTAGCSRLLRPDSTGLRSISSITSSPE